MNGSRFAGTLTSGTLLASLLCGAADLDDAEARAAALAAVRSSPRVFDTECLNTRRIESFEEELFGLRSQLVRDGRLNQDLFVYEVVSDRCYRVDGGLLTVQATDHPGTFGYVVVSRASGKTYRLWTDAGAAKSFNRLTADLELAVNEEGKAEMVATLYRGLTLGPHDGDIACDSFQVKQLAERSFYRAFRDDHWSKRFDRWWRRYQSRPVMSFDVSARKGPTGWTVTGKAFRGFVLTVPRTTISGHPAVYEWSLLVSPQGMVTELPSRVVFE